VKLDQNHASLAEPTKRPVMTKQQRYFTSENKYYFIFNSNSDSIDFIIGTI